MLKELLDESTDVAIFSIRHEWTQFKQEKGEDEQMPQSKNTTHPNCQRNKRVTKIRYRRQIGRANQTIPDGNNTESIHKREIEEDKTEGAENSDEIEEIDKCTEALVQYTWQLNFNYIDINHDKIIDRNDMAIQENVFRNVYNLSGFEADCVNKQIHEFWSCMTFNSLERGLSKDTFVTQITQSYKRSKKQHIRKCIDVIFGVVDHDQNGFLSINELAVYLKSFNMGNQKLIEKRYSMICPATQNLCSLTNATAAVTDSLIGDNEKIFEAIMDAYSEVGIYLDDLVE